MSFVDGFLNLFKVQDDEFDDDYDYDEEFDDDEDDDKTSARKKLFQVLRSQMMKIHQLHLQ